MLQTPSQLPEIKLIGIQVRTNNAAEANWMQGKIFPCVQQYFHQEVFNKIPNRKKPNTTYCAYTDYESDHTGDYTYFIGEEVSHFDQIPDGLSCLTIPTQQYTKFTTEPGAMPQVLRQAWVDIWEMPPEKMGGNRRFHTDFEVYDERATDHQNIVLDIYLGLKESN